MKNMKNEIALKLANTTVEIAKVNSDNIIAVLTSNVHLMKVVMKIDFSICNDITNFIDQSRAINSGIDIKVISLPMKSREYTREHSEPDFSRKHFSGEGSVQLVGANGHIIVRIDRGSKTLTSFCFEAQDAFMQILNARASVEKWQKTRAIREAERSLNEWL